jgi:hypothetical protein
MLPLNDFFFHLVTIGFNERIELALTRPALAAIAGVNYATTSAFGELGALPGRFAVGTDGWGDLPRWLYQIKVVLSMNAEQNSFVEDVIDAFGARRWLVSGGSESEGNVEGWLPACMVCRFFVQLMSDMVRVKGWSKKDFVRLAVIHRLKVSPRKNAGINRGRAGNVEISEIAEAALHEVGTLVTIDGARVYRLKAEFESLTSPFWIYYPVSEFLKQVDQGVPRLDPDGSHEFVGAQSFRDFIARTARIVAATDTNPGLVHAFLALVEMTVAASRTPAVAEILLRENVFAGLLPFKGRLVHLIELIATTFPAVAEPFGEIQQRLVAKGKRPNKSKILGAFAAQRQASRTTLRRSRNRPATYALIATSRSTLRIGYTGCCARASTRRSAATTATWNARSTTTSVRSAARAAGSSAPSGTMPARPSSRRPCRRSTTSRSWKWS